MRRNCRVRDHRRLSPGCYAGRNIAYRALELLAAKWALAIKEHFGLLSELWMGRLLGYCSHNDGEVSSTTSGNPWLRQSYSGGMCRDRGHLGATASSLAG